MFKRVLIVTFILLVIFAGGCVGKNPRMGEEKLIYASPETTPRWITSPPQEPKYKYFIGLSTQKKMLEDARQKALNSMIRDIVEYIMAEVKSEYEEEITQWKEKIKMEYTVKGKAQIEGPWVKEIYYEKWEKTGAAGIYYYYNYWILAKYPLNKIVEERKRIKEERAGVDVRLKEMLENANISVEQGLIEESLSSLLTLARMLEREERSYPEYEGKALSLLSSLTARIKILKEEEPEEGNLKVKLVYSPTPEKSFPIPDIPVIFALERGEATLISSEVTDSNGLASCEFKQHLRVKPLIISAGLNSDQIFSGINKPDFLNVKKLMQEIKIYFNFPGSRIGLNMKIEGLCREYEKDIREKVESAFIKHNFDVVDRAKETFAPDLTLEGRIAGTFQGREVIYQTVVYKYFVSMEFRLIDREKRSVIASTSHSLVKSAFSPEKALHSSVEELLEVEIKDLEAQISNKQLKQGL